MFGFLQILFACLIYSFEVFNYFFISLKNTPQMCVCAKHFCCLFSLKKFFFVRLLANFNTIILVFLLKSIYREKIVMFGLSLLNFFYVMDWISFLSKAFFSCYSGEKTKFFWIVHVKIVFIFPSISPKWTIYFLLLFSWCVVTWLKLDFCLIFIFHLITLLSI